MQDPGKRLLQKALAEEITTRVHSKDQLAQAQVASEVLFGSVGVDAMRSLSNETIEELFEGVGKGKMEKTLLSDGLPIIQALVQSGFLASNGEARRALQENSISINKQKQTIDSVLTEDDLLNNRFLLMQRGKKTYFLLEFQ